MNSRGFSGFFGYFGALPKKPKKTLAERIRGLLAGGRSIVGRGDIQRELWPNGFTLEDTADLNRTLNRMIRDGRLRSFKLGRARRIPVEALRQLIEQARRDRVRRRMGDGTA